MSLSSSNNNNTRHYQTRRLTTATTTSTSSSDSLDSINEQVRTLGFPNRGRGGRRRGGGRVMGQGGILTDTEMFAGGEFYSMEDETLLSDSQLIQESFVAFLNSAEKQLEINNDNLKKIAAAWKNYPIDPEIIHKDEDVSRYTCIMCGNIAAIPVKNRSCCKMSRVCFNCYTGRICGSMNHKVDVIRNNGTKAEPGVLRFPCVCNDNNITFNSNWYTNDIVPVDLEDMDDVARRWEVKCKQCTMPPFKLGHKLSNWIQHLEKDCPARKIKCDSSGCDYSGQHDQLEEHKKVCPFVIVTCIHCENSVKASEINSHLTPNDNFYPCRGLCECLHGCRNTKYRVWVNEQDGNNEEKAQSSNVSLSSSESLETGSKKRAYKEMLVDSSTSTSSSVCEYELSDKVHFSSSTNLYYRYKVFKDNPNKTKMFTLSELKNHMENECKNMPVDCSICHQKTTKKNQYKHNMENSSEHLQIMMSNMNNMSKQITDLKASCESHKQNLSRIQPSSTKSVYHIYDKKNSKKITQEEDNKNNLEVMRLATDKVLVVDFEDAKKWEMKFQFERIPVGVVLEGNKTAIPLPPITLTVHRRGGTKGFTSGCIKLNLHFKKEPIVQCHCMIRLSLMGVKTSPNSNFTYIPDLGKVIAFSEWTLDVMPKDKKQITTQMLNVKHFKPKLGHNTIDKRSGWKSDAFTLKVELFSGSEYGAHKPIQDAIQIIDSEDVERKEGEEAEEEEEEEQEEEEDKDREEGDEYIEESEQEDDDSDDSSAQSA